jgi:hypothetical protein
VVMSQDPLLFRCAQVRASAAPLPLPPVSSPSGPTLRRHGTPSDGRRYHRGARRRSEDLVLVYEWPARPPVCAHLRTQCPRGITAAWCSTPAWRTLLSSSASARRARTFWPPTRHRGTSSTATTSAVCSESGPLARSTHTHHPLSRPQRFVRGHHACRQPGAIHLLRGESHARLRDAERSSPLQESLMSSYQRSCIIAAADKSTKDE